MNAVPHAKVESGLTENDKSALEGIVLEKYYISDSLDVAKKEGGTLPQGSTTYRIYVDLKPGYSLQAVFGLPKHELRIATTTEFFNNKRGGDVTGDKIDDARINENTVALDSWLAMGAATKSHFGILKSEDKDGSIIKRSPLAQMDGLIKEDKIPPIATFGLDLGFFGNAIKSSLFSTENASWAVLGGVKGPTSDNKILIAQLTTNGKLYFELNLQVGTPEGGIVRFVAKNPESSEVLFKGLTYIE